MAESMPVRCPACRREHLYAAPSYPCVCGAPVSPPLDPRGTPTTVTHRAWDDGWITLRCGACTRENQWPYPELGCTCGAVLRIAVAETSSGAAAEGAASAGAEAVPERDASVETGPAPERNASAETGPAPERDASTETGLAPQRDASAGAGRDGRRRAFQPIAIRTARDAVTVAALYLRWLGYQDIRRADQRPPSGIGLAARGLLAQVDPTVRPASERDVECLWLTAMTESSRCVYFSLAGYADPARHRADSLGIPLFVLDLTGTPQPVNTLADELDATGAQA
ncbi:hypothetical protein [Streptomyces sp. YU58]|uniref:hypothetical protein n=1 Tax=Streptomyces sp. SX92 TaxID=3158972 RepID=UPI0027B98474|nr:hypothetical protein [Streptomyces coralus]WLW51247.1 hypothetical protein QU709_07705 [Streptomyces coralus]